VLAAAHAALDRWGAGSGASRLVVGSRPVHQELEAALAAWKGTERAVLFPTGFAANLGVLSALADDDTLVCSDELNHASIIDGCRLSRGAVEVFTHRDLEQLAKLLAAGRDAGRRRLVVTDLVFSMDGDAVDLSPLAELCATYDALLVLDEAHAVLTHDPVESELPCKTLHVGTLSKTLGALGGFVAGPAGLAELIVNTARTYIFTTAPTPPDAAAALAALKIVRSPEGDALKQRLRSHVDRIAPGHPSPIIAVILGTERRALEASARLLDAGLLVPAIRPPTVPAGTSRLRLTLSAAHTAEQVERLRASLDHLGVLDAIAS
jgi:8-amino-7-oxononanoate synthase